MKKELTFLRLIPALILGIGLVFVNLTVASAMQKCNIITFQGENGLNQKSLEVGKGDCIVWLNWTGSASNTSQSDIIISFADAQTCIDTTTASVGFLNKPVEGCFISQELGYGQTASLVFNKPGVYKYQIKTSVGPTQDGEIIVK